MDHRSRPDVDQQSRRDVDRRSQRDVTRSLAKPNVDLALGLRHDADVDWEEPASADVDRRSRADVDHRSQPDVEVEWEEPASPDVDRWCGSQAAAAEQAALKARFGGGNESSQVSLETCLDHRCL